jgi:hypothetical protein
MRFVHWVKSLFRRNKTVAELHAPTAIKAPLREFVYLDEVSLRSLLSSQTGEVTEGVSEQSGEAREAEIAAIVGANAGLVAKAEASSRFQTTNSSSIQTSRKATVQSWFRELHDIDGLRLIEPPESVVASQDVASLLEVDDPSKLVKSRDLNRGSLVEFRVSLSADPVFHLGTMLSEFTSMADDYPGMFAASGSLAVIDEVQPINKILQRLLAGLIPIRAVAVDYVVVDLEGTEHVVHVDSIQGLDLKTKPLAVVGVTEHLAYWKDIRRVLFSGTDFTLLCRISRSGLQDTWTPVKLADLFRDVVPDLVGQINAAGMVPFGTPAAPASNRADDQLAAALRGYRDLILDHAGSALTAESTEAIEAIITGLKTRSQTASEQRAAFAVLLDALRKHVEFTLKPNKDATFRDQARTSSGLPLFPARGHATQQTPTPAPLPRDDPEAPRLLDVEIIAIYW